MTKRENPTENAIKEEALKRFARAARARWGLEPEKMEREPDGPGIEILVLDDLVQAHASPPGETKIATVVMKREIQAKASKLKRLKELKNRTQASVDISD